MSQRSAVSMPWLAEFFGDAATSSKRAVGLRRVLALFGLLLVAATWRLWTPQQLFPQVPLLAVLRTLPPWCQWLATGGMLLGLVGALLAPAAGRAASRWLLLFAIGATIGMLIDQHRIQPWAYQFVLVAVVLSCAQPAAAVGWLRVLLVSFYLHSAVTKLDYAFAHTLGQQFLSVLVEPLGTNPQDWSEPARVMAALAFPAGELALAVALCFARTRVIGLAGAILLHGVLLAILGPWGLDHKPGVLLWNVYFIVQDVLLFWPARTARAATSNAAAEQQKDSAACPVLRAPLMVRLLMIAAIVLPVLEPTGWFDVWPSWGLYASSAERVQLLVHRNEQVRLPEALAAFVDEPSDDDPWLVVQLGRWSLETLGAPLYPQNRFQLGVAEAVAARYDLGYRVRVVRWSMAERFTGHRQYDVLLSLPQIAAAGDAYLLNSRPANLPPP